MELRPMTQPEFERYVARTRLAFAAEKVRVGITEDDAARQVEAQIAALLPQGLGSPGQLIFTAVADGVEVGMLWIGLPGKGNPIPWVWEIWIDDAHRGKGYGRAIMLAGERELAARGFHELGLNVFGHNSVAIKLYASLGYEVTSQNMAKTFGP